MTTAAPTTNPERVAAAMTDAELREWRRNGFVPRAAAIGGRSVVVLSCALCEQPLVTVHAKVPPSALRVLHHGRRGCGGLEGAR